MQPDGEPAIIAALELGEEPERTGLSIRAQARERRLIAGEDGPIGIAAKAELGLAHIGHEGCHAPVGQACMGGREARQQQRGAAEKGGWDYPFHPGPGALGCS